MHRKNFIIIIAVSLLLINIHTQHARAQSPDVDEHRFEVGGQFSLLNIATVRSISPATNLICIDNDCSVVRAIRSRTTEPGIGGRLGYNLNQFVALEAEFNFFPREQRTDFNRDLQGLFGVKIGQRFEKFGIFGKARPGFQSSRTNHFRLKSDNVCAAIVPPPAACFDRATGSDTNFAFDVGGVVEFYPTSRLILRFDAGDTIVRFKERQFVAQLPSREDDVLLTTPAATTHNFQGSVGIGFRF